MREKLNVQVAQSPSSENNIVNMREKLNVQVAQSPSSENNIVAHPIQLTISVTIIGAWDQIPPIIVITHQHVVVICQYCP
jgi:hypothetical protein